MATRPAGELGSNRGTKCGEILRGDPDEAAAVAISLVDDIPLPMHTPYDSLLMSRIDCDVVVRRDRPSHPSHSSRPELRMASRAAINAS
jgi:hypothetical protein